MATEMKTVINDLQTENLKVNNTINGTANKSINDNNGNHIANTYIKSSSIIYPVKMTPYLERCEIIQNNSFVINNLIFIKVLLKVLNINSASRLLTITDIPLTKNMRNGIVYNLSKNLYWKNMQGINTNLPDGVVEVGLNSNGGVVVGYLNFRGTTENSSNIIETDNSKSIDMNEDTLNNLSFVKKTEKGDILKLSILVQI